MREKTEEILAKLRELTQFKSVDLYAGQLDDPENYKRRLPGMLLFFRENPKTKQDYDYSQDVHFSLFLLHSNLQSRETQILEMLDLIDIVIVKIKELKHMTIVDVIPVESSKTLVSFEIQFDYMESK